MFIKSKMAEVVNLTKSLEQKNLAFSKNCLLVEYIGEKGTTMDNHQHTNEQLGYLVEGKLEYTIGEEKYIAEPGDSWCIPEEVEHCAIALEDSRVIEVFTPVREELTN